MRLACMQDKYKHAAGGIQVFLKRSGLKAVLDVPDSRGDRERRDYGFRDHAVQVVKKDHACLSVEPVKERAGFFFDQLKSFFRNDS